MVRPSFFHSDTFFVLMNASGMVMFAATHTFVEDPHTESMSPKSESLRYGVSIIIWVCFNCPDTFSRVLRRLLRSSVFAGI